MQSIAWEYPKPLDFRNASSENWNVTEEITNGGSAPKKRGPGRPRKYPPPLRLPRNHKLTCVCKFCKLAKEEHSARLIELGFDLEKDTVYGSPEQKRKPGGWRKTAPKEAPHGAIVRHVREGSAPGHDTILEALHSTGQELAKAGETLSRADARKLMLASLARYGLTPETLAKYAKAGLEAMEVKVTFFRGEFHETEVPDWPTRYKFFAEINRIFGAAAPQEPAQVAVGQVTIVAPTQQWLPGHEEFCQCDGCLKLWEDNSGLQHNALPPRPVGVLDADSGDFPSEQ